VDIFKYIVKFCNPRLNLVAETETFVRRCRQANVKPDKMVEELEWQGDVLRLFVGETKAGFLIERPVLIKTHSLQQKHLPLLFKERVTRQVPVSRESETELLGRVKEVYAQGTLYMLSPSSGCRPLASNLHRQRRPSCLGSLIKAWSRTKSRRFPPLPRLTIASRSSGKSPSVVLYTPTSMIN